MRASVLVLVLGALAGSGVGCASIVSSGPDFVPVDSEPQGARVKLDGIPMGRTPLIVPFARSCEGVLTFELDGYVTRTLDVDKVLNGWFIGNLLWLPLWPGIPIGMTVDLVASNQGKYSQDPIRVELVPAPAGRE